MRKAIFVLKVSYESLFGMVPFVYTLLKKPSNEDLLDFLPFTLEIDDISGLIF
jgi:hypothetical protein